MKQKRKKELMSDYNLSALPSFVTLRVPFVFADIVYLLLKLQQLNEDEFKETIRIKRMDDYQSKVNT